MQLVESERIYVKELQQIVESWLIPARIAIESSDSASYSQSSFNLSPSSPPISQNSKIFEKEDILLIFSNIEIIHNIHR